MFSDALLRLRDRVESTIPDFELSDSWDLVRRRARAWAWPAVQMGVAASGSWLIARELTPLAAAYAPITAIGALGLGHERRIGRSAILVAGLFLGVVAADVLNPLVGMGTWQIGVIMAVTAFVTGAMVDRELAVTYAAINAVVLATIPGSEGWFPDRLVAGLIGVWTALTVIFGALPPRPVELVRRRFRKATRLAVEALETAADVLCDGEPRDDGAIGDQRRLMAMARRLEQQIERSYASEQFALEVTRWSPIRWSQRGEMARLAAVTHGLRPVLRTTTTVARLADRAASNGVRADEDLVDAIRQAAIALDRFTAHVLTGDAPGGDAVEPAELAIDRLLARPAQHAVLVALQEEVRGLLAEVTTVVGGQFEGAATTVRERASATTVDGMAFGQATPDG